MHPNDYRNDNLSLANYISVFYRIGASFLTQQYEKYNIGFGQFQFLLKLYLEDGLSQDELTRKVFVDKATTARSILKLSENGFVTIKIDENDKRVHRIYLTDHAKSLKQEIMNIAEQWEEKLLIHLTEEERKITLESFDKIAKKNKWINHKDSY